MKKMMFVLLCLAVFVTLAVAQNPTYTAGDGMHGIDKLGAHQNGGRGCVGCHAPHSGARGNGGNAAAGGAVTDAETGNYALWGEDLGPLYSQTLNFGDEGSFDITFGADFAGTQEEIVTGVMMCLSCHDGNIAKGAMMTGISYEQSAGLLPPGYGPGNIPTLLGNDGTAAGNYHNDHPIGPKANVGALGLGNRLLFAAGGCTSHGVAVDCLQPDPANTAYIAFINHYGSFNVTQSTTAYPSGGRVQPMVLPTGSTDKNAAFVVCTTCHTPHSMYPFSGTAAGAKGVYPTYWFISAPYNPGAPVPDGTQASSATQFCRQCHFTGAGGSNEGSGIMNVTTSF